jgi:glycosyltransferase involved in cell wall biosynthesis
VNQSSPIAIFLPSLAGGGAQRAMLKLAGAIAARDYPVDIVLAQASGPYLEQVPTRVRLVDLQAGRVLAGMPALMRYLRRERPAALVGVMMHCNLIATWARRLTGLPGALMLTERNTVSLERSRNRRAKVLPMLARICYPWSDTIVAVSQGVADDLAATLGLPRERIHVIYNPIITPEFRRKAEEPLNHPWFTPDAPPVVLGVGRLTEQKDFATLIRAFATIRRQGPARLLILGEGEERTALEQFVAQLGLTDDVSLPGFVGNPYPYMQRAAVFALSSRWEGLPGVLIEALYCSPAVVSTDCPSGPREILADGRYGRLIPVGDAEALAAAMQTALAAPAKPVPAEACQPFEQNVVVDQYLELLLKQYASQSTARCEKYPDGVV